MPPASHPQAKFDPLPPDLDITALVEKTNNFDFVVRIHMSQIDELGPAEFEKLVLSHVINGGKPMIIGGWHNHLPPWIFSTQWLQDNMGTKQEMVRDIGNGVNTAMTIGHYMNSMDKLGRQWTPDNFRDPKRQRLYLKDIDCPPAWYTCLEKVIPSGLFYLNECIGEKGGPGAHRHRNQYNQTTVGKGIAPAGDLMSNLPHEMRAQNMMCYIGHEGTYTPAHREMCATMGQNIMVETSESDKGEKDGRSIWFMTEAKDREVVSEYFLSMLGHDIEVESHFAQINAWKKAPFPVYVVDQGVGDFILIPPLAPHQVWNRGTRTMKAAWNRTTVQTLEFAFNEALPNARMVCRDEQYKCKAIVYYSLLEYATRLNDALRQGQETGEPIIKMPRLRQLRKDFLRLFKLYTGILVSETFSPTHPVEKKAEFVEFDSNITCSYCRCNIFNRFLTCKSCVGELPDGSEDTYDVCMECYAMGRSCGCISNLTWVEQWKWSGLVDKYREWRALIIRCENAREEDVPESIEIARDVFGKKSVAHICQEQLKLRPWQDINKPIDFIPDNTPEEEEPEVDDEGRIKKKRTKRKSGSNQKSHNCHICLHREWNWKLAFCTGCSLSYCYGVLWRAFDMKPQDIMAVNDWKCPKCLGCCSCGGCKRMNRGQVPYRPKGTLLGHDTKKVADVRSVESLVNFSTTNLAWLREEGDDNPKTSLRMQQLKEKAMNEKLRNEGKIIEDEEADDAAQDKDDSQDVMFEDIGEGQSGIDPMLLDPFATPAKDASVDPALLAPGANGEIDPSLAPSRMMGKGYYAPENKSGPDRILFDHPDASTPGGQNPNTTYPKLPDSQGPKKRKRGPSTGTLGSDADAVRQDFLQAQKKQKLTDAKKAGKYYAESAKLSGKDSLIVTLPVSAQSIVEKEAPPPVAARHRTRPVRKSALAAELKFAELEGEDRTFDSPGPEADAEGEDEVPDYTPAPRKRKSALGNEIANGAWESSTLDLAEIARSANAHAMDFVDNTEHNEPQGHAQSHHIPGQEERYEMATDLFNEEIPEAPMMTSHGPLGDDLVRNEENRAPSPIHISSPNSQTFSNDNNDIANIFDDIPQPQRPVEPLYTEDTYSDGSTPVAVAEPAPKASKTRTSNLHPTIRGPPALTEKLIAPTAPAAPVQNYKLLALQEAEAEIAAEKARVYAAQNASAVAKNGHIAAANMTGSVRFDVVTGTPARGTTNGHAKNMPGQDTPHPNGQTGKGKGAVVDDDDDEDSSGSDDASIPAHKPVKVQKGRRGGAMGLVGRH